MALIGHRCLCGHNDLNHTKTEKGQLICTARAGASCGRGCSAGALNEPEVMPTFDIKGRTVDRVIRPGGGLATETDVVIAKTCDCDACQSLYQELTAAA